MAIAVLNKINLEFYDSHIKYKGGFPIPSQGSFGGAPDLGGPLPHGPPPPGGWGKRGATSDGEHFVEPYQCGTSAVLPTPRDFPGSPESQPQRWQPGNGAPHIWANLPELPPIENDDVTTNADDGTSYSMEGLKVHQGYELAGDLGKAPNQIRPLTQSLTQGSRPSATEFDREADVTLEDCREAMLEFASGDSCYGKRCAREHHITDVKSSSNLTYSLESYCEARSIGYVCVPFRGGPVDGSGNGRPPDPWHVPCKPDQLFHNHTKTVNVPHTEVIKTCCGCSGEGFTRCRCCQGWGEVVCVKCDVKGTVSGLADNSPPDSQVPEGTCERCRGTGRRKCSQCEGESRVTCPRCYGYMKLNCFIQLTVIFSNHVDEFRVEKKVLPDDLLKNMDDVIIFEQQLPCVWPITDYEVPEINTYSQSLVDKHRTEFPNERQLQQRHLLRAVPITEVAYRWEGTESSYWIYGRQRKVHCPDYPQTYCWGCLIL